MSDRSQENSTACNHNSIEFLLETTETAGDFRSNTKAVLKKFKTTRGLYSFECYETITMIEALKSVLLIEIIFLMLYLKIQIIIIRSCVHE
uniref:Ovule protein n=1 Tax=Strongyloides venezuelensis TaxID=75913 RepID=A0A0K0F5R4_STRVS